MWEIRCSFSGRNFRNSLILVALLVFCDGAFSLHTKGDWNSSDFFKFITKFGFQKTSTSDTLTTQGYIYGNITANIQYNKSLFTLVILDKEYFLSFYRNRMLPKKELACLSMFKQIKTIAYDRECNPGGQEDFVRRVPCTVGELCVDEDEPKRVMSGSQFSYGVQDINQPRFWYISLVACHLSKTDCLYHYSNSTIPVSLHYDVWVVNGHPNTRHMNPWEFQFSFEKVDMLEIYLVSFIIYFTLLITETAIVWRGKCKQRLIYIYIFCLAVQLLANLLHLIHCLRYSQNGVGWHPLSLAASLLEYVIAQSVFVLLLLLVASGWSITTSQLTSPRLIFLSWLIYSIAGLLLYLWNQFEVSVIEDVDYYQTPPGYLLLTIRLLIMFLFLYKLRETFTRERNSNKLQFYLHFGAGYLVWFVYLPILALVAAQVSALWRTKLILGVTSAVNILYYVTLMHMLWPSRTANYFQLNSESEVDDDLEEYERERIGAENM